jgi:two-component system, OmpR family, sensor histidine kinase KdpD
VPQTMPSTSAPPSGFRESHPKTQAPAGPHKPSIIGALSGHIARYAAGLSIVALIMVLYVHGSPVNAVTVGFVLLLSILCASALWGLGVALAMSVAATLAYDYYVFPPVGTFNISDPRDWVALGSFVATAVIGSYLSARARHDARDANRRRREAEGLYDFSQRLLRAGNPIELLAAIPRYVVESFPVVSATLLLSDSQQVYHWGPDHPERAPVKAGGSAQTLLRDAEEKTERGAYIVPLRLKDREIGSVRISGEALSETTLRALETLIAIAVERAHMIEDAGKTEAARENERLKSVLLDAITHDFRTPLTSIKGSATGLLADANFDRAQQKELLLIIDEECDRINQLIDEASEMARLEAGQLKVALVPYSVGELISAALGARKGLLHTRPILFEVKEPQVQVLADPALVQKVLLHLIDNADRYSSEKEPIRLSIDENERFVLINVADRGPGIDESEIGQIFEKFYRGKEQRHRVPGTGMGLAIARAIVEAHGGSIGAVSTVGEGSVFTFSLPLATKPKALANSI